MATAYLLQLAGDGKLFAGVVAHRLQQAESWLIATRRGHDHQVLLDQGGQQVEQRRLVDAGRGGHDSSGVQSAAATENAKPPEDRPLVG